MKRNKHIGILIIYALIVAYVVSFVSILGRNALKKITDNLTNSQEIYFYSDKLQEKGATYKIKWDGQESYKIPIELNTNENTLKGAEEDIEYEIFYECSSNAMCNLNITKGKISKDSHRDTVIATITPNSLGGLNANENVEITITAKTVGGFEKKIFAKFILSVEEEEIMTKIEDAQGRSYLTVNLNNRKLTQKDVEIAFDPNILIVDNTNDIFSNNAELKFDKENKICNIKVKINVLSSLVIKFYKVDKMQDYTDTQNESIIKIIIEE